MESAPACQNMHTPKTVELVSYCYEQVADSFQRKAKHVEGFIVRYGLPQAVREHKILPVTENTANGNATDNLYSVWQTTNVPNLGVLIGITSSRTVMNCWQSTLWYK